MLGGTMLNAKKNGRGGGGGVKASPGTLKNWTPPKLS